MQRARRSGDLASVQGRQDLLVVFVAGEGVELAAGEGRGGHARGQRVIVRVDPSTQRPAPWTESFRELLVPYRKDLEGGGG